MVYQLEDLKKEYEQGKNYSFVFFWKHTPSKGGSIDESCLSQWWISDFVVDNISYCCCEQYMMAQKARLFGDEQMLKKIMDTSNPRQIKQFGRQVKNFEEKTWKKECFQIVQTANKAKFSQNSALWEYLKQTKEKILVEASPLDRIWGIGMGKENPDVQNPLSWCGTNLLGFALTKVRDELLKEGF